MSDVRLIIRVRAGEDLGTWPINQMIQFAALFLQHLVQHSYCM